MNQSADLQQILNGLQLGLTYAVVALGYNLTFGVLRVVNLAYGEVFAVAAYAAVVAVSYLNLGNAAAAAIALVTAIATGLTIHLIAIRPLGDVADVNSPRHLLVLVSTLGCSLALQNTLLLAFGGYPVRFPELIPDFLGLGRPSRDVLVILSAVISALLLLLLSVLLLRTKIGLRLRAIAQNRELALCSGVRADRDEIFCVCLSSSLAGVASLITGEVVGAVSPYTGALYGLKGLTVIIVGGIGNMWGAVLVALGLGMAEVGAVALISSNYRDAVAFGILLAVIFTRHFLGRR
jgi:branched-chain amino acid transport system permease protein